MKLFFLTMLVISASHAQPGPGPCAWTPPTLVDETCSTTNNCSSVDGCESITFSVACDSCYCLDLDWDCPTTCKNCQGCGWVFDGTNELMSAHYQGCEDNDCHTSSCDFGSGVRLKTGITYTLYLCLSNCEQGSCELCESECKLTATVHYASATCQ